MTRERDRQGNLPISKRNNRRKQKRARDWSWRVQIPDSDPISCVSFDSWQREREIDDDDDDERNEKRRRRRRRREQNRGWV